VVRVEKQLKELEENLVETFDATNQKAFHEVIFSQIFTSFRKFSLYSSF
jgi:hypothetical protein